MSIDWLLFSVLYILPVVMLVLGAATVRLVVFEAPRLRRRLIDLEDQLRLQADRVEALEGGLATGPAGGRLPPAAEAALHEVPEPTPEESAAAPSPAEPGQPPADSDSAPAQETPEASGIATIEERLGTKWAIYVGGAAIALGGVFLVRHAIEAGLLGPKIRVLLGGLLGLFLIAAGARQRFSDVNIAFGAIGGAHVPSVLTAAGTLILFASAYAAHGLYDLIGSATAFVLLGAIALGTLGSALLHGPALAGLGLAGAYAAPMLVESAAPAPWPLVLYLAVVSVAAFALARIRAWLWLAVTAVAGAALWGLLVTGQGIDGDVWRLPALVHIVVQAAIALTILGIEPHLGRPQRDAHPDVVATLVAAVFAGLAAIAIAAFPFDYAVLLPFAALMIAALAATGFIAAPAAAAAGLAGLVIGAVLICWPAAELAPRPADFYGNFVQLIELPQSVSAFLTFAAVASGGVAATAALMLWQRPHLPARTAAIAGAGATLPVLIALALAYLRVTGFGTAISFSLAAVVVALGFAAIAEAFDRRTRAEGRPALAIASGCFAAAAIAALAIGLTAGLERGYLTVAFALTALGTAYVADAKRLPLLRHAVAALALVVLARVVWDPRIVGDDLGATPILNWLLVGYGGPAVSFALASHYLRKARVDSASHLVDALAILFTALLGVFQIRHFLYDGDPFAPTVGHVEAGLQAVLLFGLAHALARLGARRQSVVIDAAHWAAAAFGLAIVVLGLGVFVNPAFAREMVTGGVPLSSLVPAYLLPGLMALYIARKSAGLRSEAYIVAAASVGLALLFAYAALETRHAFHGADIRLTRGITDAETWAHTIVWLGLAIAALAYGLLRGSWPARAASGLLLAATIVKVALFDLAGVTGIWRALSFLCLGAVLIAIGMVYQRLVFRSARQPLGGGGEAEPRPPVP